MSDVVACPEIRQQSWLWTSTPLEVPLLTVPPSILQCREQLCNFLVMFSTVHLDDVQAEIGKTQIFFPQLLQTSTEGQVFLELLYI